MAKKTFEFSRKVEAGKSRPPSDDGFAIVIVLLLTFMGFVAFIAAVASHAPR